MHEVTARRAATQRRLLDAALEVFAERGVEAASVEQICEAAGFSRGAFYSNFDDKDELVIALLESIAQEAINASVEATKELAAGGAEPNLEENVARGVAVFLNLQRPDRARDLARFELRLYAARNPQVQHAYREFSARVDERFHAIMSGALRSLGYGLTLPLGEASVLLQGAYDEAILDSLLTGEPVAEVAQAHLTALLRLLMAPA